MDIETKLDDDFVFYLSFAKSFFEQLKDQEIRKRCENWLEKLCGEPACGITRKRCRNIYLTQLLICMQNKLLVGQFLKPPHEVDIGNAFEVFQPPAHESADAPWLNDSNNIPEEESGGAKPGSTYVATRALPDGQGAFAYIALSLEEEPRWLGGGEGAIDDLMKEKYPDYVPPTYEMEKILARRKDPKEREKVLTFYDVLLQNIADELDGNVRDEHNKIVTDLLEQLVHDLKDRNEFGPYENMDEKKQRLELLIMLHDRVKARRNKVCKREEVLDDLEDKYMPKSFFETSVQPQDKFVFPAAMWEQAISKLPNRKNMEKLHSMYPIVLIEFFVKLLSNEKEEIAERIQRRHENIITQMKKELRRDSDKGKKHLEETQQICEQVQNVLKDVTNAYEQKQEMEEKNAKQFEIPESAHGKLYEQMKATLLDAQTAVELEAERARYLAEQINTFSENMEMSTQMQYDALGKAEELNIGILRNMKKLNAMIKQYNERIGVMQKIKANRTKQKSGGSSMFYI